MATRQTIVLFLISVYAIVGSEGFWGWSDEADCIAACTYEGYVCRLETITWPPGLAGDRWFCRLANCGTPSQVTNGSVTLCDGTKFDDLAFYVCEAGFGLVGGPSPRTCQGDETWSGTDPDCLIDCGPLSAPAQGDVSFSGTLEGDTATFTCDTGYVIATGTSPRTCQSDGSWDGTNVTCGPISCGPLTDPADGDVDTSGITYGEEATYSCDMGYELVGCERRTCMSDGNWSLEEPTCEFIVLCPLLTDPDDGSVTNPDPRIIGSTATFSCDGTHELVGDNPLYCTSTGNWSNVDPECLADCDALPLPDNAYTVSNGGHLEGDGVEFGCLEGYEESGDTNRTCQSDGMWDGVPLSCDPIDCMALTAPADGAVDTSNGTDFENAAVFSCDSYDFWLNGCDVLVCTSDGTWVPSTEPTCDDVDCPELAHPSDGYVDHADGRRIGNVAFYYCDPGYGLDGDYTRYCLIDGTWSGSAPICRAVCLPVLTAPEHGDVTGSGNLDGDSVTVSCDRGFEVSGSTTRTCQLSGWDGTPFSCVEIDCGSLSDPTYGGVEDPVTTFEGIAEYYCDDGYYMIGPDTRTCLSDGMWSGSAPTCNPIDCGAPTAPCDGSVSAPTTTLNGVATYSCNTGFTRHGDATQTCRPNGWEDQPRPCCEITECPELTDAPEHGSIDNSDGHWYNDVVTYTCDTCWTLMGSSSRTCQAGGTWSGTEPTCQTSTFTLNSEEFSFFLCLKSWGEAMAFCHGQNAELARVSGAPVNNFIVEKLTTGGIGVQGDSWWSGATDAADEGTWVWNDDTSPIPVTYFDWASGESVTDTAENCMAFVEGSGYKWHSEQCTADYPFICMKEV